MIKLLNINSKEARVRIVTDFGRDDREWTIDMKNPGLPGAIKSTAKNGERCTIGMFRTRDGSAMDPDYAKLRKAVDAVFQARTQA